MTFNFIFFLKSEYVFLSYFIYLFLAIRLTVVWNCLRTYRPNCVIQQETSKKKKSYLTGMKLNWCIMHWLTTSWLVFSQITRGMLSERSYVITGNISVSSGSLQMFSWRVLGSVTSSVEYSLVPKNRLVEQKCKWEEFVLGQRDDMQVSNVLRHIPKKWHKHTHTHTSLAFYFDTLQTESTVRLKLTVLYDTHKRGYLYYQ